MQKAIINLETLTCPSCIQKIENALKGMNGIEKDSVEVLFNSSKVKANFDAEALTMESIEKAIEDLGYPVIKSKARAI
ncbi:heavy-metal-associated domain-containing protein [Lentibacillus cibarius]|uniref:Heavy-metal-associated domain-containing protein n=1 Tax=Lentibacillus cibarius TaxID=2583219 RepID=A0A5S3QKB7_9BACI|nr:heavy-metal-associated domain-containing protein [Lentibacillus cibarius]TMN22189.1 heavy-metal-associated domain-containing protein [Lentibacillus cibarius]